jgi:hypothetical protein
MLVPDVSVPIISQALSPMVPLIDLINHHTKDEKLRFYIYTLNLGIKMLERADTEKINKELALDY